MVVIIHLPDIALPGVMGNLAYLICIAVAGFAVLAQPAVAQDAKVICDFHRQLKAKTD